MFVIMILAQCLLCYCKNRKYVLDMLIGFYLTLVPVEIIFRIGFRLSKLHSVWQRTDALMRYFS